MWHNLREDILDEFDNRYVDRTESILFDAVQRRFAELMEYSAWLRTTSNWKRICRAACKRYYERQRGVIVKKKTCACGTEFAINANRARANSSKYCSTRCPVMRASRCRRWDGKTLPEWANETGVAYSTLHNRVAVLGWAHPMTRSAAR